MERLTIPLSLAFFIMAAAIKETSTFDGRQTMFLSGAAVSALAAGRIMYPDFGREKISPLASRME